MTAQLLVGGKPLKAAGGGFAWSIPKALKGKPAVLRLVFRSGEVLILTQSFPMRIK